MPGCPTGAEVTGGFLAPRLTGVPGSGFRYKPVEPGGLPQSA